MSKTRKSGHVPRSKQSAAGKSESGAHWVTCSPCGKRGYFTRRSAKRHMKDVHPDGHMNVYACPEGNGFHIGHLGAGRIRYGRS